MKVAIFTNNYLPNPYGVTTSIESFREEFIKNGHTVYVFAPHNKDYKDKDKNIFRYPSIDIQYKIKYPLPIPYSKKVNEIIEKLDFDIIHSQHPNLLGKAAMNWAKKKRVPLVFTWHTIYDKYTHYAPFLPQKLSAKWVIGNSVDYANRADKVIIPTDSVGEIIKKWGVVNREIITIPTGVNEKMFQNYNSNQIRESLRIDKNKKIILSISRLTEEKNVIFLVKEVVKILKINTEAVFILGGGGYLKNKLIEIVNRAKVSERVFFTGLIEKDEIKNYMSLANIFVYASKSETQGTIITEAMYMGLSIMAIDSLGVGDLIEDGKTGLLSTDNNFSKKIKSLLADEKLVGILGKNAKKEAREKYTSKICAEKMIKVYEELIRKMNN
ncbi:MAG TPA: hypothetical protein DDY52_00040 [Candidatus Moranbacteria bacterium]|nr:hypothetical protein [Candidatus Moranbacteria bacterium]